MTRKIKCFLLTFVALGFLQLESSAMETDDIIDGRISILIRKVNVLQEKLDLLHKPLRATFKHSSSGWQSYTNANWAPITFDIFEGDEILRGDLSQIKIPEDGVYSLFAHYCWHANNNGSTAPYTAIAIGQPDNIGNYFVHHHLAPTYEASDNINRVTRLKKDDKVMVSIYGSPNAEYFLGHFQFDIEKIN